MTQAQRLHYSLEYDRLSKTWSIVNDRREAVASGLTGEAARALLKERNATAIEALGVRQTRQTWRRK